MAISSITFSLTEKPEAFGRTTAESLSLGTPVIGYNHGGTGEILKKWFPIGLVKPFMIDEAADKVAIFLQTQQQVPSNNPFPLQNMLDSTINIYNEVAYAQSINKPTRNKKILIIKLGALGDLIIATPLNKGYH